MFKKVHFSIFSPSKSFPKGETTFPKGAKEQIRKRNKPNKSLIRIQPFVTSAKNHHWKSWPSRLTSRIRSTITLHPFSSFERTDNTTWWQNSTSVPHHRVEECVFFDHQHCFRTLAINTQEVIPKSSLTQTGTDRRLQSQPSLNSYKAYSPREENELSSRG